MVNALKIQNVLQNLGLTQLQHENEKKSGPSGESDGSVLRVVFQFLFNSFNDRIGNIFTRSVFNAFEPRR